MRPCRKSRPTATPRPLTCSSPAAPSRSRSASSKTNSKDDDPWVWLEAVSSGREKAGDQGENAATDDYYVLVNESSVARVEFRFKRGDPRSIGFADSADPPPGANALFDPAER
jgi:hypothetical protein